MGIGGANLSNNFFPLSPISIIKLHFASADP